MNTRKLLLLPLLIGASVALGQTTRSEMSREERMRQFLELQQQLTGQFKDQQYEKAVETANKIIEVAPKLPDGAYNLACALARLGKADDALAALEKAVALGYADPAHMRDDADLESLRKDKRFEELALKARENETKGNFEKAEPLKGFKTVEGFPEGGLRYRLRLSEKAAKDKPHRLVIWLHPSGGSGNNAAETLASTLAKNGYALLVFTQKNWMGWSEIDAAKLDKSLAEVARTEGLVADRPLLMGFSAGGQMAIELWRQSPGKFGALILDAAYPVSQAAHGGLVQIPLPDKQDIKKTPIFVLVGSVDRGSRLWADVAPRWQAAGVPLTVHVVPRGQHQWLFGKEQVTLLDKWLAEVKSGKLPMGNLPSTQPARDPQPKRDFD